MASPHLKHTPGPWLAKPHDDEFFKDVNILKDDGLACAVALVQGDITEDVAKANANLIAAAPEMLDALESWIIFYDNARRSKKDTNTAFVDVRDLEVFAGHTRAAINKATGRA